ncbi:hypothetical protein HAZT_HAZT004412 [Hyalella azteca]|uniref:Symplekin C-terminal domain-containing protein n=1 Tax=Hyalella azteca TaxID=294128 RepID=A0A6A0GNQ2_HYAAZ|nr:hypothetical protein HAZT_HAZT004412 [Hyalella azteca]
MHLIEADKCDVKTVIKATGLCFQERSIYTAEVLAEVLQQLLDEPVIPTLFMRTVIMTLTHHPQLLSLIISVLLKLIEKKVWEQPKIWEGFVKCCERASPQCVAVLLQLPIQQLSDAFEASSMLKNTLATHIKSLTKHQKSSIGLDVLALVGALDETPDDQDRAAATTAPVREIPAPLQDAFYQKFEEPFSQNSEPDKSVVLTGGLAPLSVPATRVDPSGDHKFGASSPSHDPSATLASPQQCFFSEGKINATDDASVKLHLREVARRRRHVQQFCKHGVSTRNSTLASDYNLFDAAHCVSYCKILKSGSSTMLTFMLRINGLDDKVDNNAELHGRAQAAFPAPPGQMSARAARGFLTVTIVRHPFRR